MPVGNERLKEILAGALEISEPGARREYLRSESAGDAGLLARVEALIQAYETSGDLIEGSAIELPAEPLLKPRVTRIDGYQLLQPLGEGAFGLVFLAEQQEPVRRRVALKVIKAGMDTKEVITRFEAERQALALMDHPNIAKVLEGGTTEGGHPYFVMELVNGVPIIDYCDHYTLDTKQRLKLFIEVCQGVQHAHQNGIIHRDLKPTNILVTEVDGEPVPKIIDFGIAKALGQKLTEHTLATGPQQMMGTPAYMSPEQAHLGGVDVDTRSDVYSLGVLLYELLTGETAFDKEMLTKVGLDEARRLIRETEPAMPSTRLRLLGPKLEEVARQRQAEPVALQKLVSGDLDWVVMKCLEKGREQRYQTASALAEDLKRYLQAVACSRWKRPWKLLRR